MLKSLEKLAREKNNCLEKLCNGSKYLHRDTILRCYLAQYGMKFSIGNLILGRTDITDVGQVFWSVESPNKEDPPTKLTNHNFATSEISLPNEILLSIAVHLEPEVLMRFLLTCKSMIGLLRNEGDQLFWNEYNEIHFKWTNRPVPPKAKFIQ